VSKRSSSSLPSCLVVSARAGRGCRVADAPPRAAFPQAQAPARAAFPPAQAPAAGRGFRVADAPPPEARSASANAGRCTRAPGFAQRRYTIRPAPRICQAPLQKLLQGGRIGAAKPSSDQGSRASMHVTSIAALRCAALRRACDNAARDNAAPGKRTRATWPPSCSRRLAWISSPASLLRGRIGRGGARHLGFRTPSAARFSRGHRPAGGQRTARRLHGLDSSEFGETPKVLGGFEPGGA